MAHGEQDKQSECNNTALMQARMIAEEEDRQTGRYISGRRSMSDFANQRTGKESQPKRAMLRLHGHEVSQQQAIHEPDRTKGVDSEAAVVIKGVLGDLEELGRIDDSSESLGAAGVLKGLEGMQKEVLDMQARLERDMDDISQSEDDFDNPMSLADLANSLAA